MLNRGAFVLSLALRLVWSRMYDAVDSMPAPFTRELFLTKPLLEGKQIYSQAVQCLATYSNKEVGIQNRCYGRL